MFRNIINIKRNVIEYIIVLFTGTGKTLTGVTLIELFCKINKQCSEGGETKNFVVFCGPSNKSVDLVTGNQIGMFLFLFTSTNFSTTMIYEKYLSITYDKMAWA